MFGHNPRNEEMIAASRDITPDAVTRATNWNTYTGEIGNNYVVRAYLGGRLDESGVIRDPMGMQTANLADDTRAINQWAELQFPAGTMADNIELLALGTIVFYEIEILARDASSATTVEASRWGRIKYLSRQLRP
jgi:hypothetical protein